MIDGSKLKGLSFGLVSGVITTLGMMIGLDIGTSSKMTVILGVITIAIADAFSDALGIHVSEEAEQTSEHKVWSATIATFFSKIIFSMSFVIPLILLELTTAVIFSAIYGLILIGLISYYIAKKQKEVAKEVVAEHLIITILVITVSYIIGSLFASI